MNTTSVNNFLFSRIFLIYLFVIIWFSIDFIDYYYRGISQYFRFVILILSTILMGRYIRVNQKNIFLLLIFCLFSFLLNFPHGNFYFSSRFLVLTIAVIIFFNLFYKLSIYQLSRLISICSVLIFIQCVIGLFLGLNVYSGDGEFGGSKGFIVSTNQMSYILIFLFASSLVIHDIKRTAVFGKERNIFYMVMVFLPFISSFIVSTKAAMLGNLLILFFYVFNRNRSYTFFVAGSLFWVFFFVNDFVSTSIDIFESFSSIKRISFALSKSDSVMDAISSGRWERVISYKNYFLDPNILVPSHSFFVNFESDFFDLIFNFGILGTLVTFYVLFSTFRYPKHKHYTYDFVFFLILLTAFTSGHLSSSIISAPCIAIFGIINCKCFRL